MDKKLAAQHDQFIVFLTGAFKLKDQIEFGELVGHGETMGIEAGDTSIILDILVSDNVLDVKRFPAKGNTTITYSLNPRMSKLIFEEGGYKKRRKLKMYEEGNTRFTYLRHWIWFVLFILSLATNIILILNNFI